MSEYKTFIDNVKRCPKCGSNQLTDRKDNHGKTYIHCHACKAESTYSSETLLEAMELWNKGEVQ